MAGFWGLSIGLLIGTELMRRAVRHVREDARCSEIALRLEHAKIFREFCARHIPRDIAKRSFLDDCGVEPR